MNVLIPKFEEEHPEYKVNAVSHEWADLHDKILISANSNTLPDVARLDIAWVPEFEAMDILVPLDQEIADFSDVAAALLPSAMSTGQVNGATTPSRSTRTRRYSSITLRPLRMRALPRQRPSTTCSRISPRSPARMRTASRFGA